MNNPFRRKRIPRRRVRRASNVKVNKYISPRKKSSNGIANRRRAAKKKRLLGRVLVFSTVTVLVTVFLWSNSRITEVLLVVEQENYRSTVEQYLNRNPFANYKPFVSQQSISENLTNKYPEIESVVVRLPFFGEVLEIEIIERQAQLVLRTNEDDYYIVDRNGYAYDTYDPDSVNERVVILTDDTVVTYDLAVNRFVPSAIVEFIEKADTNFKSISLYEKQTLSYRITDEARVIYVKPSKEKYEIKMQLDRPVETQISSLSKALVFYQKKNIKPTKYIDVRINGTVYYK